MSDYLKKAMDFMSGKEIDDKYNGMIAKAKAIGADIAEKDDEILRLRAENEKLRAALKPFADELNAQLEEMPHITDGNEVFHNYGLRLRHLHAAAAALKETGDE